VGSPVVQAGRIVVLLPKNIAVERIRNASNARDAIEQLREQFEVSRELAAWQITDSAACHTLGDS
jgi:hypothetical protein